MRRILIFSLVYYPRFVGGAEVAVKEITDRIPASEFQFDMITLNGGGEEPTGTIGNITIHRILGGTGMVSKFLYPFAAYLKARRLHRVRPYDMVWAIMASYAGFAAFLFKKTYPTVPNILTIQEGDHFGRRSGLLNPFFRWIFRAADQLQVISNFLADWSREMGARAPITVVPNAVDIELFAQRDERRISEIRQALNKKDGDIFLITTSRLTKKNGIADVIDALAALPAQVKFIVLGNGELEKELKVQVARLKLQDRVRFLGYVPHSDMPAYLHASDIFIRPSLTEGLGNSFLEAMAAGLPVIATPVGGIPDFLIDGETGLFCEVHNPHSITRKVEKLIKDRESREYIVKRAGEMVRDRYQWKEISVKMKEIFNKV